MKLKGLALTLPICDLRPLLDGKSRRPSLSPSIATLGQSHIVGFGAAKERKLNIPWRDQDTVFFNCAGAISLSEYLPDGESVNRAVRRVYLDGRALVRFEFMLFCPPKHHYSEYYNRADEFARAFWEDQVTIKQRRSKTEESFSTAIPLIVNKFVAMTTPDFRNEIIRSDLVQDLAPQIQVIGEVSREAELEALKPQHFFEETGISLAFRSLKMKARAAPVDVVYITYPSGRYTRPGHSDYEPLSHIRAHVAWLHADLEVLTHILQRCIAKKDRIEPSLISDYVVHLANGLQSVPSLGHPQEEILFELASVLERFHEKRISRLLRGLKESALPTRLKSQVISILCSYLSRVEPDGSLGEEPLICPSLIDELDAIREGRDAANEYHSVIVTALQTIFCHELGKPRKEQEIDEGRKRVDIVFNNRSQKGFFYDLTHKHNVPCPYVFFECKNYASDPKNPELDQLICRLNDKRGRFGAVVCRNVDDKETMLRRCRDAVHGDQGYPLVLDDSDIKHLLQLRANRDSDGIDDYMDDLFRQLVL